MSDAEEKRRIAGDWREYLKDTRESFNVFRWVWRELISSESKRWTKRAVAYITAAMIVFAAMPFAMSRVFNGLVSRDGRMVVLALAAVGVCRVIGRLLMRSYDRCREIAQGENIIRMDARLSELFFGKSLGQHMRDDDLLSAANVEKGRGRVHEVENTLLFDGVPTLIELTVCWVFLWVMAPLVGLVMTGVLVFYLVWSVFMNRKVIEVCTPIDADWRRINRRRVERWDHVERVKTCDKEGEETDAIRDGLTDVMDRDRDFWLWAIGLNFWRGLLNNVTLIGVMSYGAWRVWQGDWTVGLLYPLFSWSTQFAEHLWKIGQVEHRLNWCLPSVKSMMEAVTLTPDVVDGPDAKELQDGLVRVEVDRVTHRYPASKQGGEATPAVLTDVSISVGPGEKVALIGESGAGKTTVMRLLQRYFDPTEGAVRVNGEDLRNVKLRSWRRLLAYIPQQAQIFDGPLRANLLYGLTPERRKEITDEDLWKLMRTLRIDFGERLTAGLDTIVGRRGVKLSGGEAQRVMIGAAIIQRPRFLIVDEATSSLDSTTEREVQHGLATLLEASTAALIITHRLPTVRHLCTKFIVLKASHEAKTGESQVEAEAGSFEELYALSPTFRRLADDQGVPVNPSSARPAPVPALSPNRN